MTAHHERMSSIDTAWLRMDGPDSAMMIIGVSVTATPVRAADFRHMVETRVLCFPRFRHRPVADALGASWVEDTAFDLDRHLEVVRGRSPVRKAQLQARVARLASQRLDPARPLWQIHFIERYLGGSAWILRVHHCYADGMAMMHVLLSMTEQDAGPAMARRAVGAAPRPASRSTVLLPALDWLGRLAQPGGDILEHALAEGVKLLEGGIHRAFHPEAIATAAAEAGSMLGEFARVLKLPDDPPTPLRGALSGAKAVAWADPLPLADVKTVSHALDCTVNDVLMATVAAALGGHLRSRDFDTDGLVLRASVPMNLRAADEPMTLGNKFGLVFVDLPIGVRNPLQRVFAMHDAMTAIKGSMQPPMTLATLGLMGLLPGVAQAPLIELFSRKGSVVVSNVPGPQAPLHLCGQRITEMYFWVPQSGSMGIGISLLSYAGQVHCGVIADRNLVADPGDVVGRFAPEFEQLLLAVTVGALAAKAGAPTPSRRKAKAGRRRRSPAGTTYPSD